MRLQGACHSWQAWQATSETRQANSGHPPPDGYLVLLHPLWRQEIHQGEPRSARNQNPRKLSESYRGTQESHSWDEFKKCGCHQDKPGNSCNPPATLTPSVPYPTFLPTSLPFPPTLQGLGASERPILSSSCPAWGAAPAQRIAVQVLIAMTEQGKTDGDDLNDICPPKYLYKCLCAWLSL